MLTYMQDEEVLGPPAAEPAAHASPGMADYNPAGQGRGRQYPVEVVERALFEMARHGGSARKAQAALALEGMHIPEGTMRVWRKSTFRNRYHEIASEKARELEEMIAVQATDLALKLAEAEDRALRVTVAGLSQATGLEASTILRNLSMSKSQQVDKAQGIRGRPNFRPDVRGLTEIVRAIKAVGGVEVVEGEAVAEAEVVEAKTLPKGKR